MSIINLRIRFFQSINSLPIRTKKNNGNVSGIYLIKNYKHDNLTNEELNINFENYLNNLGKMYEIKIEKMNY